MSNAKVGVAGLRKLFWSVALSVPLLVLFLVATGWQLSPQNSITEVGIDIPEMNGYEFIGRIDQEGTEFTAYGYLYYVHGLEQNQVFSNPLNPSETTAHFTYYATATLSSRAILTDAVRGIFALDSVGTINFYHQATPSATFTDPLSFAGGTSIATASLRYQDILSVQSPNRGLVMGNGEFTQLTADSFTIGTETYNFGRPGMIQYISTMGEGLRTDPTIPRSSVLLAGNATSARQRQVSLPSVRNQSSTP